MSNVNSDDQRREQQRTNELTYDTTLKYRKKISMHLHTRFCLRVARQMVGHHLLQRAVRTKTRPPFVLVVVIWLGGTSLLHTTDTLQSMVICIVKIITFRHTRSR